jgi:hypothetical protein
MSQSLKKKANSSYKIKNITTLGEIKALNLSHNFELVNGIQNLSSKFSKSTSLSGMDLNSDNIASNISLKTTNTVKE